MDDFIRAFFDGYIKAFGYQEPDYLDEITLDDAFKNIGDEMWNNIERTLKKDERLSIETV